jgi:hypothetical protein
MGGSLIKEPLPQREAKGELRPMGTPRELLTFLTDEIYRYHFAMRALLPGLEQATFELRQKPDSDVLARGLDSNKPENWSALTQAQFVFITIRGILSMTEAIRAVSGSGTFPAVYARICSAIGRFERDTPYAKDMRDLLTHLDAYLLGGGHKQLPTPEHRLWLATPDVDLALYVGGVALSVSQSVGAAEALFEGVRDAVQELEQAERASSG